MDHGESGSAVLDPAHLYFKEASLSLALKTRGFYLVKSIVQILTAIHPSLFTLQKNISRYFAIKRVFMQVVCSIYIAYEALQKSVHVYYLYINYILANRDFLGKNKITKK